MGKYYQIISSMIILVLFSQSLLYGQGYLYKGSIVDSSTQNPILLANVIYGKESTITNNNGEFKFVSSVKIDSIIVVATGYTIRKYVIDPKEKKLYLLSPISVELPEVNIVHKKINPLDIIKKVKDNLDKNYMLNKDFYQECYLNLLKYNYDTLILNAEYIADKYVFTKKNLPWLNLKERNIGKQDSVLLNKLGLVYIDIYQIQHMDFIQYYDMFKDDFYKKYSYKLIRSYIDDTYGAVYVIQFIPDKLRFKFAFDWFAKNTVGQLIIRKQDYAIVSTSFTIHRDIQKLRSYSLKYNKKPSISLNWRTLPNVEIINLISNYEFDEELNKYYLNSSDYTFIMQGEIISNNQSIQIIENLKLQSISSPITVVKDTINFGRFQSYKVENDVIFWNSFNRPKQNEYRFNDALNEFNKYIQDNKNSSSN